MIRRRIDSGALGATALLAATTGCGGGGHASGSDASGASSGGVESSTPAASGADAVATGSSTGGADATSSGADSATSTGGSSAGGGSASGGDATSGADGTALDSGSGLGPLAHGTLAWVDATGAIVPFSLQFGFGGSAYTDESGGMFLDSNEILWSFGAAACGGALTICPPYAQYNNSQYSLVSYPTYWDGADCTGTPYVPYVHAGVAFTLEGPGGSSVRALGGTATVAMQFLQSSQANSGGCMNSMTVHILAAPLSDAPVVTPPAALPFTLPLHPELLP